MAVSSNSDTRLGCGRHIDEVWDSIGQPPDAHERSCPDCRRARASLLPLAEASRAARQADADDPDLQPAPRVLTDVMSVVRAEVRRGRRLPLDEPHPEQPRDVAVDAQTELTVSEQTVVAVARRAADRVPGVQVRRCRVELVADDLPVEPDGPEGLDDAVSGPGPDEAEGAGIPDTFRESAPRRMTVTLQISVASGTSIPRVGAEIRRMVQESVSREVGMRVVAVHIDVRDIHDV